MKGSWEKASKLFIYYNISQPLWFLGHPPGEPQCYAYTTRNNEYLMLSCSWEGGFPRALLWWSSNTGDTHGKSEENSNILILRSSATYSGKSFVCHAQHPLFSEGKQCVLKLGETQSTKISLSIHNIWHTTKQQHLHGIYSIYDTCCV